MFSAKNLETNNINSKITGIDGEAKRCRHSHLFTANQGSGAEKTRNVIFLTLVMMVGEIGGGMIFGSMALLADGWHMGTHAAALGITVLAYKYARKHASNPAFSFGAGKVGVLGGFSSAIFLAVVAFLMMAESIERFFSPVPIRFNEAIGVAVLGLAVNLVSAYMLKGESHPGHRHSHNHAHQHDHKHHDRQGREDAPVDHNLKAAYMHVLADALTSVLAIAALAVGKFLGWVWLDPIIGVVGGAVILRWAYGLLTETGVILLDRNIEEDKIAAIQSRIEEDGKDKITDLHVWKVNSYQYSAILSIISPEPRTPDFYKDLLADLQEIVHINVEVNQYSTS